MVAQKSPYNLPGGGRNVDNVTYNPQADAGRDNAAFDPDADAEDFHPVGARGAANQPTNVNFGREDREAEQSEQSNQIPRREVDDLFSSSTQEERSATGTRGMKNDAWKQERNVDQAFRETGLEDADQDVDISAGTGRG
ncbi:hypothetical protein C8Q75DRAFT_810232 [Abortiporus biennis]|nr:hypothetical protein C8Q75DRAFT_810232 [Abortiporus biennis]